MAKNEKKSEKPDKKSTAKADTDMKAKKAAPGKAKKPDSEKKPGVKKSSAPKAPAKKVSKPGAKAAYSPRLRKLYLEKIVPALIKRVGYKNILQVPAIDKIVLNMGLGNAREDANMLKGALEDLAVISGQKAQITYAKKPISNFKIREKDPVGARVTLRQKRMYEFLDRLLSLAIPRVRDFRGMSNKSFDGRGNYSFGVTEQIIFPEIDYDKIDKIRGLDVTLVTTANTDEEAYELLSAFGFPFRVRPQEQQSPEGANA
ncbi:MAG: 50S ribosomal protein L5 [Candidatus Marinimicrobia bacterium]|nr:50S ribosomal protein L5 [Candidatus Neomarinimicrobiota bacterium]